MMAWSAKVLTSSICVSENAAGVALETLITPIGLPPRSIGTDRLLRYAAARATSWIRYSGSSRTSGTYSSRRERMLRATDPPRPGRAGKIRRSASAPSGSFKLWRAARWMRSPSKRNTALNVASQSLRAFAAIVSKTGCTSVGELEMTRRISLVAVCCSRDSVRLAFLPWSSVSNRAFSMAMAAWSAKVSIRAIWLSLNGRTSMPIDEDHTQELAGSQHRDREHGPNGSICATPYAYSGSTRTS